MPQRDFDTATWGDPKFQPFSRDAKLLFIYLWTNPHCNQAGLYEITPITIAFEVGFDSAEEVIPLLKILEDEKRIAWCPDTNIVWVKNFLRRQTKSPKFLVAAIGCLKKIHHNGFVQDFLYYNRDILADYSRTQSTALTRRECVIIRDNFTCQYCGKDIETSADFEADHVIPLTKGGRDKYENIVTACRDCNQKKLDHLPEEVGFDRPNPSSFHGSQASMLLKINSDLRERWEAIFNKTYKVETISLNMEPISGDIK